MILKTKNDLIISAPKTYLTNDEVAGTTVIRWRNPSGFGSSWAVQIGETGEEKSKVYVLNGAAGATQGTLTGTTHFAYSADSPIYATKWDQIVFERSTIGTVGTATPMTNGTVTIQADHEFTQFDDTSGSSTYAYRTYFRSSGLAVNSTESDWITPSGFTFYSLAGMRQRVRDKLWDSNFIKDDLVIDNWINEWRDQMVNSLISVNEDYAIGTVNVAFDTAGLGTVTTTDFKQPKRIEVTYNGSDYFLSTKRDLNTYFPNETVNSAHPYHNWEGNTVLKVMPSTEAGTAKIWYYKTGTPMVNDTDELDLPIRSYTDSFVNYALGMAYQKDGKANEAQNKLNEANNQKNMFVVQSTPRDKSSQTFVQIQEVTSGDDSSIW